MDTQTESEKKIRNQLLQLSQQIKRQQAQIKASQKVKSLLVTPETNDKQARIMMGRYTEQQYGYFINNFSTIN